MVIRRIGILIILIVISFLYGCGSKTYSLEDNWQFVSLLFDGTEVTADELEATGSDVPTLICTKNEFELKAFDNPISGTWESSGDKQYSFIVDDAETFVATLKIGENNKKILTITLSYEAQKATGGSMTIVFESVTTSQENTNETTDDSSIDTKKLDDIIAVADSMLKSSFGSDYSLVYDQGGVTISFSKKDAALSVALAKIGSSEAVDQWGGIVEGMQTISTTLQDILEQNELSGIPVTVQCFDKEDKDSALAIVVDGKVTYDASK